MPIRTSNPLAREMMAYAQVVLGEAQCHGGFRWIDYNRAAPWQCAAVNPTISWNTLDPGLQSIFTCILGQQRASISPRFCSFCQNLTIHRPSALWPFLSQPLSIRHKIRGPRGSHDSFVNRGKLVVAMITYVWIFMRGTRLAIAQCRESLQGRLLQLQLQSRV